MSDERTLILQNFTKKLSNCRHNVPIKQLLEYLDQGKFGYTCPISSDEVELNEFVFADDIYAVVNQIRAIIKEPHIFLKRESVIQNVSVAPNIDTEALIETYTDYKLWKVKDGSIEPEFVHAFVNEDNLAIYENRFIYYLMNLLYSQVSKRLATLTEELRTLNVMAGLKPLDGGFTIENYFEIIAHNNGEIPVVANCESAEIKTLNLLIKCKKLLRNLMDTQFYLACKKAQEFVPAGLKPTNILMMDKRYNYCYNFYINFIKNKGGNNPESQSYVSFIVINFINALIKDGFVFDDQDAPLFVAQSGRLTLPKTRMVKEPFAITLSKADTSNVLNLDIELTADASITRYAINIVDNYSIGKIEDFTDINAYAKLVNEQRAKNVERAFLITEYAPVSVGTAAYIVPNRTDTADKLRHVLMAMLIGAEIAIGIHSRICPVCGSSLIAPEDTDYICTTCECKYHLYSYGKKEYAWIKTLPRPIIERSAIYNDFIPEEVKVEEEPLPPVVEEPVEETNETQEISAEAFADVIRINKSFIGKLKQSDEQVQNYYEELRNYMLSFKRVRGRVSWHYDSFNVGREQKVKLAFKGKKLAIFLALDPAALDEKYFIKDMGDVKKFEEVPAMLKIKSDRGLKYAKQLIDIVFAELDKDEKFVASEYKFEYATDEELIEQGLAKYSGHGVVPSLDAKPIAQEREDDEQPATENQQTEEVVEEPVVEEVKAEEIVVGEPEQEIQPVEETAEKEVVASIPSVADVEVDDASIVRMNKSFVGKLMQADQEVQNYYQELRNYLLSFKRVNGRISWHYDSFNVGREQKVKLAFKGKRIAIFLALDPLQLDEKYHVKDMGEIKKFEEVPAMLKIKSDRGLKYAKQLIDILFADLDKNDKFVPEEFNYSYATDEQLVEQGLAKFIESKF